MRLSRPNLVSFCLVAASVALFALAGHYAADALIESQRSKQLLDVSQIALRRLESAAAYGALTLDELASRGAIGCDPASLQALRLNVYEHGAVKDVRVVNHDGSVICSAYAETLEFDIGWAWRDQMAPGRDRAYRFFRVEQFFGMALGVMKDVDSHTSLAAILGVNASLFDVMPAELRDDSEVILETNDGATISRSSAVADLEATEPSGQFVTKLVASNIYPLRAFVRVGATAYRRWNQEPYYPIVALSALLGLALGALMGRLICRPPSALDDIDRALAAREFQPFLQPIFNLGTGAIVGCEILARWVRADGSMISPTRFIPLIENNGRIEALTWQILGSALAELQEVMRRDKYFKAAVNISPQHILAKNFVADLRRVVAGAKVSARQIVLEITEREELDDLAGAAAVVAQLRELGFRVALDDVGIGHSGLSYIQKLGANTMKIDKFFVDSICRDAAALSVVAMLVRLARELGMHVVAEGIEEEAQRAALQGCGIEEGQGYLVSPPVPPSQFIALVEAQEIVRDADLPTRLAASA